MRAKKCLKARIPGGSTHPRDRIKTFKYPIHTKNAFPLSACVSIAPLRRGVSEQRKFSRLQLGDLTSMRRRALDRQSIRTGDEAPPDQSINNDVIQCQYHFNEHSMKLRLMFQHYCTTGGVVGVCRSRWFLARRRLCFSRFAHWCLPCLKKNKKQSIQTTS